jgi:hypothetical protein
MVTSPGVARRLAIVLLGAIVPVAFAVPAHASHGHDGGSRTSGSCGSGVRWKLKAGHDDRRIEVEAEVDSGRAGQRWHWVLKHDGSVSAKGSKRTRGRSGSWEVERRITDLAGKDHVVFRATHGRTVCRGTISS